MNWAAIVGMITVTVEEHLIQRYEYVLTENRVLRSRMNRQPRFTNSERVALTMAAKPLGRSLLGGS